MSSGAAGSSAVKSNINFRRPDTYLVGFFQFNYPSNFIRIPMVSISMRTLRLPRRPTFTDDGERRFRIGVSETNARDESFQTPARMKWDLQISPPIAPKCSFAGARHNNQSHYGGSASLCALNQGLLARPNRISITRNGTM